MKKVIAIIMAAVLLIGCMPMMAFAAAPAEKPDTPPAGEPGNPGSVNPEREELIRQVDGKFRDLTLRLKKLVTNKDLLDRYDKMSKMIDEYKPILDAFVEELRNEKGPELDPEGTKDIDYYGKMTDAYIHDINQFLVDKQQSEEMRAILTKLRDALQDLNDLLDKYGLNDKEMYKEKYAEVMNKISDLQAKLAECAYKEILKEALEKLLEESKELAEKAKDGFTREKLAQFIEQVRAYCDLSELINKIDPDDKLDELRDKIRPYIEQTAARLGDLAKVVIERLKDKIKPDDPTKDPKYENAIKVKESKPVLKKVKAKKGGKAVVSFKGLKDAEATKYQISYKMGKKKAKIKTYKKATTSDVTLKYTLKKLKKGKKYTVKVRAVYEFEYQGNAEKVVSKWSNAKKVKAK